VRQPSSRRHGDLQRRSQLQRRFQRDRDRGTTSPSLDDWEYGPRDVGVVPVPTGSFWYDEHSPAYLFVDKQKTT
jgi:hypothetical protein